MALSQDRNKKKLRKPFGAIQQQQQQYTDRFLTRMTTSRRGFLEIHSFIKNFLQRSVAGTKKNEPFELVAFQFQTQPVNLIPSLIESKKGPAREVKWDVAFGVGAAADCCIGNGLNLRILPRKGPLQRREQFFFFDEPNSQELENVSGKSIWKGRWHSYRLGWFSVGNTKRLDALSATHLILFFFISFSFFF